MHDGFSSSAICIVKRVFSLLKKATMSIFANFVARYLPTVRASDDSELVDPQKVIREECHALAKCSALHEKLNTCNDRVNSRKETKETCTEELFDYMHCVDHCAAKTLLSKLK